MKVFEPHGDTRIEVRGRTLIVKPQGHLNDEEVRRNLQHIHTLVPGFGGRPWAALYLLSDPTLLTPEAEDSATLATPQFVAAGLSAVAIVHPAEFSGRLQEAQVRAICADIRCPIQLFERETDAVRWLSSIIGD